MNLIASIILAACVTLEPATNCVFNPRPQTRTFERGNEVPATANDCYVCLTVTEYTNLLERVSVLWEERNEGIADIKKRRPEYEERQKAYSNSRAIERVRENMNKRKSKLGRSSGGVK